MNLGFAVFRNREPIERSWLIPMLGAIAVNFSIALLIEVAVAFSWANAFG